MLSGDFHNHATMHLMAELFERHNKEKFELVAFSFGLRCSRSMERKSLLMF